MSTIHTGSTIFVLLCTKLMNTMITKSRANSMNTQND